MNEQPPIVKSVDPIPLGYAPPTVKNRARRGQESWAVVIPVIAVVLFLAFLIPYSVSTEPEFAFIAVMLMWSPAAIYLWLRITLDFPGWGLFTGWIIGWSTLLAVTFFIQLSWWFADPGFPNPRFRLPIVIPGMVMCGEMAVGFAGGMMIRKRMLLRPPVR